MTPENEHKMRQHIERGLKRAERDLRWVNWYWNRGRVYGSGREMRSAMRRASWRRVH